MTASLDTRLRPCLMPDQVEELLKDDEPDAITFERIHGRSSSLIQARDLDLHRFAPRDFPTGPLTGLFQEELPAEPERVLLTGANGFLGRFLLLDYLERVSKTWALVPQLPCSAASEALLLIRSITSQTPCGLHN